MMRPDDKSSQHRKLFVGGLHPKTNEDSLRSYYSQWGDITDVVVMRDQKSHKSRGFGFVTYSLDSSVDEAQRNRPHKIDGKDVDSKRAMPRDDTSPEVHAPVKKIFVGGLKKDVTSSDLDACFSRFGKVTDAQVVMAKDTGTSRGFAFVTFEDNDCVDKVILARPIEINGNKIDVRKALNREDMNKIRSRQVPQDYNAGWNDNGGAGYQNNSWDQGYNQYYGQPSHQQAPYYGNSGYGYNGYDSNPSGGWHGVADGFGSYQHQAYAGGPMRAAPAGANQYSRPAPYAGNGWSQR